MSFCPKCSDYVWALARHVCPPTWRIYYEDFYGDEFEEVPAYDAEQAATKWADRTDSNGDHDIVAGKIEPVVTVTDADGENAKRFAVRGESQPVYYAHEVKATGP